MKVLCVGHATYDISLIVSKYPKENTKYAIDNTVKCGGGSASNCAYLLGKWGIETYFKGIVGKDEFGKFILNELRSVNVNTKYVEQTGETSLSFILVNESNGYRTLFSEHINKEMKNNDVDITPDIILTDGYHFDETKHLYEKFPAAIKVIDAGRVSDNLLELCKMSDYIISSKGFAETVTKTRINFDSKNSVKEIYKSLEKLYKDKVIVVTLEEKGCLYKMNNKIKIMSALTLKPKDTTGCGDIFHGAFVFGLSKKLELEKCLKIANIAAGLSVKKVGSRVSIPNIEEVYKIYEKNR